MKLIDIQNRVARLIDDGYTLYPGKYLWVQIPVADWNELRAYKKTLGPITHFCQEHCRREHFVYCGEALVAGSSWTVGAISCD